MTAADASVLSKKIKGSVFNVSAFPLLDDLARASAKSFADLLLDMADCEVSLSEPVAAMKAGPEEAAASLDSWAAFCLCAGREDPNALVALSPKFIAALSEAMLGGAFALPEETARLSTIDIELARPFVIELIERLNAYLEQTVEKARYANINFSHASDSVEDAISEMRSDALFSIGIGLEADEGAGETLCFIQLPASYVEMSGLLCQARQSSLDNGANEEWRAMMQSNVFAMSVDLPVVIGKYIASLSELSRLEVGQVIPLEDDACQVLDITLKTDEGPLLLGKGRLGAFKNHKAIKVTTEIVPRS